MSSGNKILELNGEDAKKIVVSEMHLGNPNCNFQMQQYVFKRNKDGVNIINIRKMWQKLILAARIIAAVENPEDVCVVSSDERGHRAVIKFAKFIGCQSLSGRFSPGSLTNHSQCGFKEPRLLILTNPKLDHQAVREASYVNIPVIALCDVDTTLKYIDVVIPCNNRGSKAIGLSWWFLAREVMRLKGKLARGEEWDVMPDLFFHRNLEDINKQEEEDREKNRKADQTADDQMDQQDTFDNQNQEWTGEQTNTFEAGNEDWAKETQQGGNPNWEDEATETGDWAATEAQSQQWN